MAYIWDIPGWNSGAKVRCDVWDDGKYIRISCNESGNGTRGLIQTSMACMLRDDWTLYKEEPEEIEVFEWMYQVVPGYWSIVDSLLTEVEAAKHFNNGEEYRKTGRSFKVPATKKENGGEIV